MRINNQDAIAHEDIGMSHHAQILPLKKPLDVWPKHPQGKQHCSILGACETVNDRELPWDPA